MVTGSNRRKDARTAGDSGASPESARVTLTVSFESNPCLEVAGTSTFANTAVAALADRKGLGEWGCLPLVWNSLLRAMMARVTKQNNMVSAAGSSDYCRSLSAASPRSEWTSVCDTTQVHDLLTALYLNLG